MRRAFFVSPELSWLLMASACMLALGGCTTTRQCLAQTRAAEASGAQMVSDMANAEIVRRDAAWLEMYCKAVISEEMRFAYISNAKSVEIPHACAKFVTAKGWHKK